MSETCGVCGKQITGIISNFTEHAGKVSFWTSPDMGETWHLWAVDAAPAENSAAATATATEHALLAEEG